MKHWKETAEIVRRVEELASNGRHAALATVVHIVGSSYRRPGAKFLVQDDNGTLGGVSGGCLEADVREIASGVMRTGLPRLLHYDTGADDRTAWGLGLGCNGSVDIFVQPATQPPASDFLKTVHVLLDQAIDRFAICTVVEAPVGIGRALVLDGRGVVAGSFGMPEPDPDLEHLASIHLADGRSQLDRIGARRIFTEVLSAPSQLIVCGAGDDACPLVAYASAVGFLVTVVDHRPAYLSSERFPSARQLLALRPDDDIAKLCVGPDTFVVVKTHSYVHDRGWVRSFLERGVGYIGLLGPRARKDKIAQQIRVNADRLFGPVGLDIGADGPEQIAISIVAELLAVRAGREPWPLRRQPEAIHAV